MDLSNNVLFALSPELVSLLKKYKCSIRYAWYDALIDQACVVVRLDILRMSKRIQMPRHYPVEQQSRFDDVTKRIFSKTLL